ncbi:MAG: OmpA family protein, partial [Planctomycetia bacterium]
AAVALPDFQDLLAKADALMEQLRGGKGTVGRLLSDDEAYQSLQRLTGQAEQLLISLGQNSRALKQSWPLRNWVDDQYQLLLRPDATIERKVFAESDLFERDRAVLTEEAKQKLADVAAWIHTFDAKDSELLVASFAGDDADVRRAELTSVKQAEAALAYLQSVHSVEKTGWFTWRTVRAHGFGAFQPPAAKPTEGSPAPARRLEILVFVK